MKSPFTGKDMPLKTGVRSLTFRKESFDIAYRFYICEDSGQQFTDNELDEVNLIYLYNRYRDKHNLPFPAEIKAIKERYGLSASKMSEVLGFGPNTYRQYENGEVPSKSNGNLIQMIRKPKSFKDLVTLNTELDDKTRNKLVKAADRCIHEQKLSSYSRMVRNYLMGDTLPEATTGYRVPDLDKLTEMTVFFTEQVKPFKTKLNKLLFYADFLNYRNTGYSISGSRYKAIQMGPVPNNYNSLFEYMANEDHVAIWATNFPNGAVGDHFKPNKNRTFNQTLFTDDEFEVLKTVVKKLGDRETSEVIEISHEEPAWKEHKDARGLIDYQYALNLKYF